VTDEGLRTTDVDGVPVFWVPGRRSLNASLWFRTGMADETLPTSGWLHLLEHLALHDRDSIRTPVNGHVDLLFTSFHAEGEPAEVAGFLHDVCRWLSAPDFAQLEHERRVLRAEGATRTIGTVANHLLWRYGAQGPGLSGYEEFGLSTATPDGLRQLAAATYTRGNAVLALSGPPPAGLRLPLAAGPRQPARRAVPCDQPAPAGFNDRPGTVAVSGTLPRSAAATTTLRALERALQRNLRDGAGMGYSAWSSYELMDADQAMATAGIDILPDALPTIVATTASVLRRLRDVGPDPAELRDDIEQRIRLMTEEPAEHWLPFLTARDALLGQPIRSREALVDELRAVTADDVRRAAHTLWTSLLLSADPGSAGDPQLHWLDVPPASAETVEGRTFRPLATPAGKARRTLTVGPTAARLEAAASEVSARYDELAALVAFPDGGRKLIRRDGYQVVIEPGLWRRGQDAVAMVDSAVPRRLHVVLPERAEDEIPRTTVTRRRRLGAWLDHPVVVAVLTLAAAAWLFIATDSVLTSRVLPVAGIVAVVVGLATGDRWKR